MTEQRLFPAIVLAASIAVLGGAFLFQYIGGLAPCVLCIYQRYPYGITIALSVLALIVAEPRMRAGALALCGIAFLVGAGIGVFHVGVEQHWWEGTAACTGNVSAGTSLEAMKAQLLAAPIVRCDRVAWSLFGISMAGYNVLISLGLAGFSLAAARRVFRRTER
ncbi:MAG TPA: disulfide bond formation protein B [Alphaproteobacteria bacterium]|nr:disulfide bond formation protein B [Alphaproteobacteria bacterium]